MKDTKPDLILHPIRMKIILAFAGQHMTTQELAERLQDVPQATLYRHLGKLTKGGVLQIVEERPIRGTIEKVYALPDNNAILTVEDLAEASAEDHMRYFTQFVTSLIGDFGRYIGQENPNYEADGIGYRQVPLNLTDEELKEMVQRLQNVVKDYSSNSPSPERRRKTFTTIIIPDVY
ncbi:MAG TPA: helix-turn-helix domain-containing protein [Desulfosporosinus sp.]|nr:helix-turn-helix domain-containing protein [Desulfosporosinus sp.]